MSKTPAQRQEMQRCKRSMSHFVTRYCQIYNATEREWIAFDLWPAQRDVIKSLRQERLLLILKARQLGLSWLTLAYALWQMFFYPAATVLIFNKRDEEAAELLGRIKGMAARLPDWMLSQITIDNSHTFALANGSGARAFPTTGGRSYTGSLVIVDEADFMPDLDGLLNAVKPTIDAGGQMILISTVDKSRPESPFKRIYRSAKAGATDWRAIFLPWHARPERTQAWYETQKADVLARTGALDDLHQEYPNSPSEALAPRSLDKRISPLWIEACYEEQQPLEIDDAPAIPGLEIYVAPQRYGGLPVRYVIGADPAEGNPASDDSALTVLAVATGEECAVLAGKYEPSTFGAYIAAISSYYFDAPAMIERNNHGHAVIQWVAEHADYVTLLRGHDDKVGWMSSSLGKAKLYTEAADHFRQNAGAPSGPPQGGQTKILHSFASYTQLASIEGSSLRAPVGMHDDRADSFAMAHVGRAQALGDPAPSMQFHVAGRGGRPQMRRGRL